MTQPLWTREQVVALVETAHKAYRHAFVPAIAFAEQHVPATPPAVLRKRRVNLRGDGSFYATFDAAHWNIFGTVSDQLRAQFGSATQVVASSFTGTDDPDALHAELMGLKAQPEEAAETAPCVGVRELADDTLVNLYDAACSVKRCFNPTHENAAKIMREYVAKYCPELLASGART